MDAKSELQEEEACDEPGGSQSAVLSLLNMSIQLLNENATLAAFTTAEQLQSDTSTSISSVTKRGRFVVKDTPSLLRHPKQPTKPASPETQKSATAAAIFQTPLSSGRPPMVEGANQVEIPPKTELANRMGTPSLERQVSCDILLGPAPSAIDSNDLCYKKRHNSDLASLRSPPSMYGIGGSNNSAHLRVSQAQESIVMNQEDLALLVPTREECQGMFKRIEFPLSNNSLVHQETPMFFESRGKQQSEGRSEVAPILNMMQTQQSPRRAASPKIKKPKKSKKLKKRASEFNRRKKKEEVSQKYLSHMSDMMKEWKEMLHWQSSQILQCHVEVSSISAQQVMDAMTSNMMGVSKPREKLLRFQPRQPYNADNHQTHNLLDFSASFIEPRIHEEMKIEESP